MLVPIQGAVGRSHSENQGEAHPYEGPPGNSRWRRGALGGGGESATFMEAATKRTKGASELPHSHHHHWSPIEEFIYSDPRRRDMLKQRYN